MKDGLDAYIIDAVRTPRGAAREGGALQQVKSIHLLKPLYQELGQRLGPALDEVSDVVLGCVTAVGDQGANIAKISALFADWPESISGMTLNRFCASGLDAVTLAAVKVHSSMENIVVAGGVESMSRVPLLKDRGAWFADPEVSEKTGFLHMGISADLVATQGGISREEADRYALASHQRAARAQAEGRFAHSIIPVRSRDGAVLLDHDESVDLEMTAAKLSSEKLAFPGIAEDGGEALIRKKYPALKEMNYIHTNLSSPARVDGAALVAIANRATIDRLAVKPRAQILSYAHASVEPVLMLTGAVLAAKNALAKADLHPGMIDLWEVNESFAGTVIDFMNKLELDSERVNVNGGAIALGHALGATGSILVGSLMDELDRQDLRYGCVAICAGAGIGQAIVIERIKA
ncbi:MAG: acetyl-CoA C-acyltransferase [Proteobacteria bacterium]|nr:MAG: acetyl-CoA C-acyltransferase [Pseudomonadota bacterium]